MMQRLVSLLALLACGAMLNIAVAWFCALRVLDETDYFTATLIEIESRADTREAWWVGIDRARGFGCEQREVQTVLRRSSTITRDGDDVLWSQSSALDPQSVCRIPINAASGSRLTVRMIDGRRQLIEAETVAGWPMYALWGCLSQFDWTTQRYVSDPISTVDLGKTWLSRNGLFGLNTLLPVSLIWPGFAINTLFYAALLCLPFTTFRAARRWYRTRRGLCSACAYPVGKGQLCTECGKPVAPQWSLQPSEPRA